MTRASVAYQERYITATEKRLFLMGNNATRWCEYLDLAGVKVQGVRLEETRTNAALQSQTLGTTWAKITAGDVVTDNAGVGPDGTSALEALAGDATDAIHGFSQAVTMTATKWWLHTFARAGDRDWLYVDVSSIANVTGYFRISTAAKGTIGVAVIDSFCRSLGGGLIHAGLGFTGTVAAHTCRVCAAHADGDNDFAGDGAAKNIYLGCAMATAGAYPSSYIITTTAPVARAVDGIIRHANPLPNGKIFSGALEFLAPIAYTPLAADIPIMTFNDGTANNVITIAIQATTGYLKVTSTVGAAAKGECVVAKSITDGYRHMLSWSAKPGGLMAWVDDTAGTYDDTDVDVATGLANVDWQPSGGVIGEVRPLVPEFVTNPSSLDRRQSLVYVSGCL